MMVILKLLWPFVPPALIEQVSNVDQQDDVDDLPDNDYNGDYKMRLILQKRTC